MARSVPDDRLEALVRVATEVFIEQGYRRTQMADVAAALGVAKGTLYLYVESKEALFDLVCRWADRRFVKPDALPVRTPAPHSTLEHIGQRLTAALGKGLAFGERADLETIVLQLYDVLAANRYGLKLIDRSARDLPELAAMWFGRGRGTAVAALASYLEDRMRARRLRRFESSAVAARFIVETCAFWAVHRHWDAAPQDVDDALARRVIVELITAAFAADPAADRRPNRK